MIRSKTLDMDDLKQLGFVRVDNFFNVHFGNDWPEVPLRRWEYCAAILFSDIISKPGVTLDAGCGQSVFPMFLEKIECKVFAVDPGTTDRNSNGVHYRNGSMTDLAFDADQFDYVFAISSIEHVNAGKFAIPGMDFDTGDTKAILELCRVLKPGGVLVLTTDFADRYYPPPGLWPSGSHRVYDLNSILSRLVNPVRVKYDMGFWEEIDLTDNGWDDLKEIEPKGHDYTEAIITMRKPE